MSTVHIRRSKPKDGAQIGQLIYDTVRTINIRDYSEEQVQAWAPDPEIFSTYDECCAYVAEINGKIVAFGNLTLDGYLHRFYVHKDFQGQGIGAELLRAIEAKAKELNLSEIRTEASITAKPFFLSQGYTILEQQKKILRGVAFINYKMVKVLN